MRRLGAASGERKEGKHDYRSIILHPLLSFNLLKPSGNFTYHQV
jgi:hypothetical protein